MQNFIKSCGSTHFSWVNFFKVVRPSLVTRDWITIDKTVAKISSWHLLLWKLFALIHYSNSGPNIRPGNERLYLQSRRLYFHRAIFRRMQSSQTNGSKQTNRRSNSYEMPEKYFSALRNLYCYIFYTSCKLFRIEGTGEGLGWQLERRAAGGMSLKFGQYQSRLSSLNGLWVMISCIIVEFARAQGNPNIRHKNRGDVASKRNC